MSERRQPNNYNNRNRRGRGGRGRGRGGGRGGQQAPPGQWTDGGEENVEPEDFPHETQSGLLFGLGDQVVVPGSIDHGLLQAEVLETLKRLPPDIVNLMLAHFDKCVRDGGIRNKSAYLLGIINSGPRMGLPSGVVVPASVKFSLMQGVIQDDLTALPVPVINTILGEFDAAMRERGSTVHDRYSFLADIIRKHKKDMPPQQQQQQQHDASQHQYVIGAPAPTARSQRAVQTQPQNSNGTNNHNLLPENNNVPKTGDQIEETRALLADSMKRVQLLTERVAKVTADLVAEKERRSSLEAIAKSEQVLREATDQSLQTALSELEQERELRAKETAEYTTTVSFEKDRREAELKEIIELKEKVQMERSEKNRAEDRLSVLEEVLISERDVRIHENGGSGEALPDLPDFNSADFDSDCESK